MKRKAWCAADKKMLVTLLKQQHGSHHDSFLKLLALKAIHHIPATKKEYYRLLYLHVTS